MSVDPSECQYFNTIIASAIGLLGTILGIILGWVLNNWSKKGRLTIFNKQWWGFIKKSVDEAGNILTIGDHEKTEIVTYRTKMDIYNSSTENKIMRNIRIYFYRNKELLLSDTPKDLKTEHHTNLGATIDEIDCLNIPAKTTLRVDLLGNVEMLKDKDISRTNKGYIFYTDEKKREKKVEIPVRVFFVR